MTLSRVREVPIDAGSVLHAQRPAADFSHACQVAAPRQGRSALQAYRDMAATVPPVDRAVAAAPAGRAL